MKRSAWWIVGLSLLLCAWIFTGQAPDATYRIFPGYIPDPQQWWSETPFDVGAETPVRLPGEVVLARQESQVTVRDTLTGPEEKQILFGDTHVHTTNSADAFMYSLPLMHGAVGAFPPAYACDYARFISQLDFYFLTDHAESFTPSQWQDAIRSVQQCNRIAGEAGNPDLVAFIGWEWTQVGATAEKHYGHHNILFRDDKADLLPARPIAASGAGVATVASRSEDSKLPSALGLIDPRHRNYYKSYNRWIEMMAATPPCNPSLPSPSLPANCFESAATPTELYEKLDQWGFDNIIIPHGSSWGFYTPPGADWHHQLDEEGSEPGRSRLIEVYSGHGNSEVFRDFAARRRDSEGNWYCPEPQDNYLPACWQAGNIIRQRCLDEGAAMSECETRAEKARHNYVQFDTIHGFMTVPDSKPGEWLDAGQARDVFLPAFNYRPKKSAQYGLALQNFDDPEAAKRFRWGFVASTDTHSARAGHGFKPTPRKRTTDANGVAGPFWESISRGAAEIPAAGAHSLSPEQVDPVSAGLFSTEFERTTSFMTAGGIAAVHARGRSRESIWEALKRREVYGTSGHRILLWFDLVDENFEETLSPMGSEVALSGAPSFRVNAVGSFKQLPGCPSYVVDALESRKLEKMAGGECYHPSDERYNIVRIEVIKIRPQINPDEPVASLIEDPWRVFECPPSPDGCVVEFSDPDFAQQRREAVYYVRALEEPASIINAGNLRTRFDENGAPVAISPCNGDYRTPVADDCLKESQQRAWSSPIFVSVKGV
ncbi:MAG: hypothetical protein ACI9DH_000814 [Halioglobus sp.]|jgi:hypothetical protein